MTKYDDKTFGLIAHPFWNELLSIRESDSTDNVILKLAKADHTKKVKFLQLVLNGFYPLSNISYLVFKRVENVTNGEAAEIVRPIYETEAGLHPLVKGTRFEKMIHPAQYKLFIESLLLNTVLEVPVNLKDKLIADIDIKNATLAQAIASAYIIENSAPGIIHALQDFACKWQVYTSRSSKRVEYNFIYEHGLIEGSEAAEQHLCLVEALLNKFKDRIVFAQFELAAKKFVEIYHRMLDGIMMEVHELSHA